MTDRITAEPVRWSDPVAVLAVLTKSSPAVWLRAKTPRLGVLLERLEAKRESDFMLLGAGLLILGMIIAVVLPWLKPTKKIDSWA